MLFSRDYRRPFWQGFLHALCILFYVIFISLIYLSVLPYFPGYPAGLAIQVIFSLFVVVLSAAVCGYFLFFEPLKKVVHHHFRPATVMMASTLGWLFIFLIIFVVGYVLTIQ